MYNGIRIPFPRLERRLAAFGNKCICFDSIDPMIIAGYYKLSSVSGI